MNIKSMLGFLSKKPVNEDIERIVIKDPKDTISVSSNSIVVFFKNKTYNFEITDIQEAIIFTTDQGPIYDDMGAALKFGDGSVLEIMSEHPSYESFLFDGLGKQIDLDYSAVIKASSCTENAVFPMYKKNKEASE